MANRFFIKALKTLPHFITLSQIYACHTIKKAKARPREKSVMSERTFSMAEPSKT